MKDFIRYCKVPNSRIIVRLCMTRNTTKSQREITCNGEIFDGEMMDSEMVKWWNKVKVFNIPSVNRSFLSKGIVSTVLLLIIYWNVICINYFGKMKVYTLIYILYYWITKPIPPAQDIASLLRKYFAFPFRQHILICLPWDCFIASLFITVQSRKIKEMPNIQI